jgi:hypothetical protein
MEHLVLAGRCKVSNRNRFYLDIKIILDKIILFSNCMGNRDSQKRGGQSRDAQKDGGRKLFRVTRKRIDDLITKLKKSLKSKSKSKSKKCRR